MSHFKYFIAKINEIISNNRDNTQKPAIVRDAYRLKTALMLMGADSFDQSMALAINEVLKKLSLYSVHEIAEAVDVEFLNSAHDWNFITGVYSDYRIHHSEHKIVRQKILVNSLSCALLDTTLRTAVEETCFLTILKSYLIHVFNKELK